MSPGARRLPFHTLRHTFGSLYAQRTGDMLGLQKILGHSSIATTEKVYAHFKPDFVAGKTAALEGLGTGRISARSTHGPVSAGPDAVRVSEVCDSVTTEG